MGQLHRAALAWYSAESFIDARRTVAVAVGLHNQGLLPEELAQLQRALARGALGQVSMKKCLRESSQEDPKSLLRKRMCGECVTLCHTVRRNSAILGRSRGSRGSRGAQHSQTKSFA